jgi:predicted RNA-binding protein with PUA-like domain
MNYWIAKADPDKDYGIDDLERDGITEWTGVHNNAAMLHIRAMKPGDTVLIYHSQKQKAIVGSATVTSKPYLDIRDSRKCYAVQLTFSKRYATPLHLSAIKAAPECQKLGLVVIGRLSVMPLIEPAKSWILAKLTS